MHRIAILMLSVGLAVGVAAPAVADEHTEEDIGWGALAKLHALAEIKGVSVDELLVAVPYVNGDRDFGFGAMKQGLSAVQRVELRALSHTYKDLLRDSMAPHREDAASGAADKAALLAGAFGLDVGAVLELRESGIGWGALVKLAQIVAVSGSSIDEILAEGRGLGRWKKMLTDGQLASLDPSPKRLGDIVSEARRGAGKAKAKTKVANDDE